MLHFINTAVLFSLIDVCWENNAQWGRGSNRLIQTHTSFFSVYILYLVEIVNCPF